MLNLNEFRPNYSTARAVCLEVLTFEQSKEFLKENFRDMSESIEKDFERLEIVKSHERNVLDPYLSEFVDFYVIISSLTGGVSKAELDTIGDLYAISAQRLKAIGALDEENGIYYFYKDQFIETISNTSRIKLLEYAINMLKIRDYKGIGDKLGFASINFFSTNHETKMKIQAKYRELDNWTIETLKNNSTGDEKIAVGSFISDFRI